MHPLPRENQKMLPYEDFSEKRQVQSCICFQIKAFIPLADDGENGQTQAHRSRRPPTGSACPMRMLRSCLWARGRGGLRFFIGLLLGARRYTPPDAMVVIRSPPPYTDPKHAIASDRSVVIASQSLLRAGGESFLVADAIGMVAAAIGFPKRSAPFASPRW